ncbi:ATP-binding protein [Hydrogenophaga sp. PAMC20947]|uniref:ATP-binding protein n=1 Tax=Hydrogenophaga sp. PAMC20947 TaxID=2565558 RepID=UPI00109D9BAD|nr:ATP-binding protein [Hydrogenophaga sp. PAMC20947]QCB46782.1 HAMP domain-containing protein [Hydrogenophaga sp. PAMC20947]
MSALAQRLHKGWNRFWPDTLFSRLALLLVVVAIASHAMALALMFELRPDHPPPPPPPGMHLQPPPPHQPPLHGLVLDIVVRLGAVILAAWVGARWLSAPLRRLARSTQAMASNIHAAPLALVGTRECREAGAVINQLQQHILTQLEERDQFVAAVSHDLRTPLTRLALRVESLTHEGDRQGFGKDIREMDNMIRSTLDYLCGTADAEPAVMLDLGSLVDSIVADRQDMGQQVTRFGRFESDVSGPPIRLKAQLSAMRRSIDNLVDNAMFYGGSAEVGVIDNGPDVRVFVLDSGPGIPEEAMAQVVLPFVRLEGSRNRHTGGVGLGLAAVNDMARRHGGHLLLSNRNPGGGLQAELVFPR